MFFNNLGLSGLFILAFLGGWFLISIPNQLTNRFGAWVNRINPYGFVPKWTFFAPVPGTYNYRLIFRDLLADGLAQPWEEVDWCPGRRWIHALWHPRRLTTKLIMDSINGLAEVLILMVKEGMDVERNPQGLILSTPYVLLLNLVMSLPLQSPSSIAREFAVFQQDPFADRQASVEFARMGKLVLCSSAHELRRQSSPQVSEEMRA